MPEWIIDNYERSMDAKWRKDHPEPTREEVAEAERRKWQMGTDGCGALGAPLSAHSQTSGEDEKWGDGMGMIT